MRLPTYFVLLSFFIITTCPGVQLPAIENSSLAPPLKGRILLNELNCVACHITTSNLNAAAKKAPRLSDVGARIHPAYLQDFIQHPHTVNPGTSMPDVLAHLPVPEKQKIAEALTHYLLSLKQPTFTPSVPDAVAAEQGAVLFHSRGCVACHAPRDEAGHELMKDQSVPLGALENKYSFKSLVTFLQRPHSVRPSGRMPDMRLPGHETERIAHYLLRKVRVPGHLAYTRYRGQVWEGMDSDEVSPDRAGHVDDFQLTSIKDMGHNTALRYTGFLRIETAGTYTFNLEMNGGTLRLNDQETITLEPSNRRGVKKIQGAAMLKAGWNAIAFDYYHTGREPRLSLEVDGPDFKRQAIPSDRLSISNTPVAEFKPWTIDAAKAEIGKQHFSTLGCISCHDDVRGERPTATPLAGLDAHQGCLSGSAGAWPSYDLTGGQRQLLAQVLPQVETQALTDIDRINETLVTFNCIACHTREGVGGVLPERNHYFTSTKEALGNQGRIPPPLTHIGAKLQPEWMRDVLLRGKRQRTYLDASMPQFGDGQVAHLVDLFAKVDQLEAATIPAVVDVKPLKQAGHQIIGTDGLSCIACHDFNGQQAAGPGALDLVHATDRLQKNWFHLYMRNPARFHETVIMPGYWPGGVAMRKDILAGDTALQIESLWRYLEDGVRAKNPAGLSRQSSQIRVTDVAAIARGRGPAGYRGMAVGYPSGINLAFDCEQMNLRQLWKHEFVNTNPGSFNPMGGERIQFPAGIPFHRLKTLDDFWPYKGKTDYLFPFDHGYQFRGYALDAQKRPTWTYFYGDIKVQEFFEDVLDENGKAFFKRYFVFDVAKPQALFYFRAASGQKIEAVNDGFSADALTVRFVGEHKGVIRPGEPQELLIPLELPAGRSTLELEYRW